MLNFPFQNLFQDVAMTIGLVLGAVAHERYRAAASEGLQKPQGPFLSMVLDGGVATVKHSGVAQFLEVTTPEFAPGDRVCLAGTKQGF